MGEAIGNAEIIKRWLDYFEMLLHLDKIEIKRCIKLPNIIPEMDPDLVTFNDGNPSVFGTVGYTQFETDNLAEKKYTASLLMSKAKLEPIAHIGETYRNELCGATYAVRLKLWILQNSKFNFKKHYHFTDSNIVPAMIKK